METVLCYAKGLCQLGHFFDHYCPFKLNVFLIVEKTCLHCGY